MRDLLELIFLRQVRQMVDSRVVTTREFWRRKYFDASDAEACDPRPFAVVLAERPIHNPL